MASRYFIELAYDGSDFHGWQIQPNAKTIQETLNTALSTLLRTDIYTVGCGRTDTGVHASQYFAHFESDVELTDLEDFVYRSNRVLPTSIALKRCFPVDNDTHARFTATSRCYAYLITQQKDPFAVLRKWEMRDTVDIDRMNKGAAKLLGEKDFGCFSKSNTQTETNLCNMTHAQWYEDGATLRFEVSANRFLRNMVRAIVGTLVDLGKGTITLDDIDRILDSKDRSEAGLSVPAHGLYLTNVSYPEGVTS